MPVAADAQVLTNVPSTPFMPNPPQFDALSQRNHHVVVPALADPGDGAWTAQVPIPQAGILSGLWIHFTGTLTLTGGGSSASTKANRWPHGLINTVEFSTNFNQQIISATGPDLHVHRWVTNPSMPVGGMELAPSAGTVLSVPGAFPVSFSLFVPIAADKASLIGALYAQSAANLLTLRIRRNPLLDCWTVAGGGTLALTGTYAIATDFFDIPRDPATGAVITPDIRRLHGFSAMDVPLAATGQQKILLPPQNGNLLRLFMRITSPTGDFNPDPDANSGWTKLTLHYGSNKNPQEWDLASLINRNVDHYGAQPPYNYVILDFLRENPVRDAVVLDGLTDLAVLVDIASGTSIPANTMIHIVQETLYN